MCATSENYQFGDIAIGCNKYIEILYCYCILRNDRPYGMEIHFCYWLIHLWVFLHTLVLSCAMNQFALLIFLLRF